MSIDATTNRPADRLRMAGVAAAILLCVAGCLLILLIPTTSISVDSVYQGF